jgi:hypothetical protein
MVEPFYSAVESMSDVYFPTSHLFISDCFNIVDALIINGAIQTWNCVPQLKSFLIHGVHITFINRRLT